MWSHLYEMHRIGKFMKNKQNGGCQGKGEVGRYFYRVSVWDDENILEMNRDDICSTQ